MSRYEISNLMMQYELCILSTKSFCINNVQSQDEWNDSEDRTRKDESFPECDLGSAAWVGFNFVLMTWKSLYEMNNNEKDNHAFIEGSFASSLALIQHFLRRFPASNSICRYALSGYACLAKTVLPICSNGDFKRRLILASLCKVSLPFTDETRKR